MVGEGSPQRWYVVHLPALAEEETPAYPASCTVHHDWRLPAEALVALRQVDTLLAP